jgi:hypothetical protein
MDSFSVNKNKYGFVAAIIFVILISQCKTFRFLIHTPLGRLILIILFLSITSSSVLLGIIAVIIVTIMIHQNDNLYAEGFVGGDVLLNTTAMNPPVMMNTGGRGKALEGFNIVETESVLQKGKNSKQFTNVNFTASSAEDVAPTDSLASSPALFKPTDEM